MRGSNVWGPHPAYDPDTWLEIEIWHSSKSAAREQTNRRRREKRKALKKRKKETDWAEEASQPLIAFSWDGPEHTLPIQYYLTGDAELKRIQVLFPQYKFQFGKGYRDVCKHDYFLCFCKRCKLMPWQLTPNPYPTLAQMQMMYPGEVFLPSDKFSKGVRVLIGGKPEYVCWHKLVRRVCPACGGGSLCNAHWNVKLACGDCNAEGVYCECRIRKRACPTHGGEDLCTLNMESQS